MSKYDINIKVQPLATACAKMSVIIFELLTPASGSLPTPDPVCPAVPLVRHLLHDEVALVAGVPRNVPVQMDRALVALLGISTVGEI